MFKNGTVVVLNDRVGVVVLSGRELSRKAGGDLEDHTGVWFGNLDGEAPEIRTVPTGYLVKGPEPVFKH